MRAAILLSVASTSCERFVALPATMGLRFMPPIPGLKAAGAEDAGEDAVETEAEDDADADGDAGGRRPWPPAPGVVICEAGAIGGTAIAVVFGAAGAGVAVTV